MWTEEWSCINSCNFQIMERSRHKPLNRYKNQIQTKYKFESVAVWSVREEERGEALKCVAFA